ncbi:hypothetical protein FHS61_002053 [Altererythrobacter atlanticus]|uniref:Beta-lactamase class A catalytic domain-containing protein n=1 Tax=Croceibacterium atlanticum TaxID=1267766 RepID=A0A0F7KS31_9SPHN|nr:serine hydrolase [Croceibacterium atlanticum]AKH41565.1 hypothetical protein WYH_00506 [Croceibacterium atlanticum]MBB5733027.1 hypothetical protein [Croceibacterium atlanticum]
MHKLVLAFLLAVIPVGAWARDSAPILDQRAEDIVAALNHEQDPADVFGLNFLSQVPPEQLDMLLGQLTSQFGTLLGVEFVEPIGSTGGARIALRFERAIGKGLFQLEPSGERKIAGFRLTEFQPVEDNAGKVSSDLQALPGSVSVYFAPLEGGSPILSINADRQLAIGSTFKLYVLAALTRSIAEGEHGWDEVIALGKRSFPSGQMQDWPDKAPVTAQTLASMMISISDNTATDTLIRLIGRDAVEAELAASGHSQPSLNVPFMTTREMFTMKAGPDDVLAAYRAGSASERERILSDIGDRPLELAQISEAFAAGPRAIDVEWLASGQDIAGIFRHIVALGDQTALDILAINPALSEDQQAGWPYIGYKGGSEPGVLNLSWLLRNEEGAYYVLSMGWNNPEAVLDQPAFELLSQRVLALGSTGE